MLPPLCGTDAMLRSRVVSPIWRCVQHWPRLDATTTWTSRSLARCEQDWEHYWAAVRPVEFTQAAQTAAGRLARQHSLRGADAVHLASVLALGNANVVVAVWDRRLHAAVVSEALAVAPPSLETT